MIGWIICLGKHNYATVKKSPRIIDRYERQLTKSIFEKHMKRFNFLDRTTSVGTKYFARQVYHRNGYENQNKLSRKNEKSSLSK